MTTTDNQAIPNRIIRTLLWDKEVPEDYRANIDSFARSSQNMETVWYGSTEVEACLELLPQYRDVYEGMSRNIMRADMARLLLLYVHGGWYFDLDIKPQGHTIDAMVKQYGNHPVVLFVEGYVFKEATEPTYADCFPIRKIGHELGFDSLGEHPACVANYAIASRAGHPFILEALDELCARVRAFDNPGVPFQFYNILYMTGPMCLTGTYVKNQDNHNDIAFMRRDTADCYFLHVSGQANTWWRQESA